MPVETETRTVYVARCSGCGKKWYPRLRLPLAEHDLKHHECGVHRESLHSGDYRWWTDDINRACICGASWGERNTGIPFHCPNDPNT